MTRPAVGHLWALLRRPPYADSALAAGLVVLTFVLLAVGNSGGVGPSSPPRPLEPLAVLLYLGQSVPIALRRRYPLGVLVVVAACYVTDTALGLPAVFANAGLLIALYTAGSLTRGPLHVTAATVLAVGIVVGDNAALQYASQDRHDLDFVAAVFLLTGFVQRGSRSYLRRLEHRAAASERARYTAERALRHERERIARDLHDVVTHHVTAMVVAADALAGAGSGSRPGVAPAAGPDRRTSAAIADTGRQALAELRELLQVLHGDEPPVAARRDVAVLVDGARATGQPVDLDVTDDLADVPDDVTETLYRVVQECLTNAVRHAPGQPTSVRLARTGDRVVVQVVTDGPAPAHPTGDGRGIGGMAARVRAVGGDLRVEPRTAGGLSVTATLPVAR